MVTLADIQSTLRNIEALLRKQAEPKAHTADPAFGKPPGAQNCEVKAERRGASIPRPVGTTIERFANDVANALKQDCALGGRPIISDQVAKALTQSGEASGLTTLVLTYESMPDVSEVASQLAVFFKTRRYWVVEEPCRWGQAEVGIALTNRDYGIHFVVEATIPGALLRVRAVGR